MHKNLDFDLFRLGFTVIAIVIGSIVIFLKRDTIKRSYIGSLFVMSLGLTLLLIVIVVIHSLNESISIRLIIDFLLFKEISAKGANPYGRDMGYLLIVIGFELFILTLFKKKKVKGNK